MKEERGVSTGYMEEVAVLKVEEVKALLKWKNWRYDSCGSSGTVVTVEEVAVLRWMKCIDNKVDEVAVSVR